MMRCLILVFFGLGLCMLQMGNAVWEPTGSEMMAEPDECEHKGCDCNCNCASPVPVYPLGGSHNTHHASVYAAPDKLRNDYGHRPSYSSYSGYSRPKCINRDCECECNCLYEAIPYNFQYTAREEVQLHGEREAMTSTTVLTAQQINDPPRAVIKPESRTITLPTDKVVLDASESSDPDDGIQTLEWTLSRGSGMIDPANVFSFIITDLSAGVYSVMLTVKDFAGLSDTAQATITVLPPTNRAPVAIIDPDTLEITLPTDMVIIDASQSSDPDEGDTLLFDWVVPSGTPDFDPVNPEILILSNLMEGDFVVELTVSDQDGLSDTAQARIIVKPETNNPPVAIIDPDILEITLPTNTVIINASKSFDPDEDDTLLFGWNSLSGTPDFDPVNPEILILSNLMEGDFVVTLTVTDQEGLFDTAQARIIVKPETNNPPVTIIDPDILEITLPTNTAVLDGSQSFDFDGDDLQFVWEISSAPDGYVNDPDLPLDETSFTLDGLIEGDYEVFLTVFDSMGESATFPASITVLAPPNNPPKAIIEPSTRTIMLPTNTATLDGSSSSDPDGDGLTYEWNITSGPDGYDPILPAKSEIILPDLIAGDYTIGLTVTDDDGLTDSAEATLTVLPKKYYRRYVRRRNVPN